MIQALCALVFALCLTIIFESLPLLLLSPRKEWLKCGLLCNLFTNPLLNSLRILFFNIYGDTKGLVIFTIALESVVLFTEAWLYSLILKRSYFYALAVSFICNALSFGFGVLIM